MWNGRPFWFDSAHTGTEHVVAIVAIVDDVDAIDTKTFGQLVRHHHNLAPLGSNVNFVQIIGDQALKSARTNAAWKPRRCRAEAAPWPQSSSPPGEA